MEDYFQTKEYQEFVDWCAKDCDCCPKCSSFPCDSCLSGGFCDDFPCTCQDDNDEN